MNMVILRGYVGSDPKARKASTGMELLDFRLAVSRPINADQRAANRAANVQDPTDWLNIRCFDQLATGIMKAGLAKGDLVAVEGSIRADSTKNADGTYNNYFTINASKVDILIRKNVPTDDSAPVVEDAPSADELSALLPATA